MKMKKKVLLSSVLTIALCLSLIAGSTFALFTSTDKVNVAVTAGTVEVSAFAENLTMHSPTLINPDGTIEDNTNAASDTKFKNGGSATISNGNVVELINITPGDRVEFDIVVTNNSNVAAQYQTKLELVDGINLFGGLSVTLTSNGVTKKYNGMTAYSDWAPLNDNGEIERTTVAIELPATAGNVYKGENCKLAFSVTAVQGNTNVTNLDADTLYIYNAIDLQLFANAVNVSHNSFDNKTVMLMDDVDLTGVQWTPIGQTGATTFAGTFDGGNHTISNMNVYNDVRNLYSASGLFGWVEDHTFALIKNVKINNATVTGHGYVGGIAGYVSGGHVTIENCHVSNSEFTAINVITEVENEGRGDKVGGITGYLDNDDTVTNCSVSNSTICGYRDLGGLVGLGQTTAVITNCTTNNNTILCDPANNYKNYTEFANFNCGVGVGRAFATFTVADTGSTAKFIKENLVFTAEQLAKALTSNEANINVVLANDITIAITSLGEQTSGSGQYKLGGESTTAINIDLGGNKLTISTNYWSALGAKNPNATMSIKNGSMTSSQETGTWNSYDLRFADCDIVFEDVVFDKAIALENAGKTAKLTNVTINENHDYYALWITAEGQQVNIDGLTINSKGRAIKIDEQYVGTSAVVTLSIAVANITSANKAAIMVKSQAGANITLNNVDISNCVADSTNAVWVDSDASAYYEKVNVSGGTKMQEA